jgi:hypothetical protein
MAINHKTLPPASIKSLIDENASEIAKNIT